MSSTFNVSPEQLSAAAGVLRQLAGDVASNVELTERELPAAGDDVKQQPEGAAAFVSGMDEQRTSYAQAMDQTCQTVGVVADALASTGQRYLAAEEAIMEIARAMFEDKS